MSTVTATVNLQPAVGASGLPAPAEFSAWVNAALAGAGKTLPEDGAQSLITIRVVDEDESGRLNGSYRGVHKATNVLAFPTDGDMPVAGPVEEQELGDLAICYSVVENEARQQDKALQAHFAHLTVHGTLHLLGYDHIDTDDAQVMETLESRIMLELGFPDPYLH